MKKVLFSIAVLAAMLSSKVYGQLPNMTLVHHNGEVRADAEAHSISNSSNHDDLTNDYGYEYEYDFISTLDDDIQTSMLAKFKAEVDGLVKSTSIAEINFSQDATERGAFTQDEGHTINVSHSQYISIPQIINPYTSHSGSGTAATCGWHGRIIKAPDTGWTNQDVGANFRMTGTGRTCTASTTLTRMDETSVFMKATWGANYIIARFDQELEMWEITYSCKFIPNGSTTSGVFFTSDEVLDIDVNVYEYCTASSYTMSMVEAGDDPESSSAYDQQNQIYQQANGHTGSGGGAGTTTVTSSGMVKVTIAANLKDVR